MRILVLNSGSSSQKSCLYQLAAPLPADPPPPLWEARLEWGGEEEAAELRVRNQHGASRRERLPHRSRAAALERLLGCLSEGSAAAVGSPAEIDAVGHRIVHGGREFREATRVTPEVIRTIAKLSEIAPLHNRAEVGGIRSIERLFGPIPQVAVFDTAFHRTLAPEAAAYAGPHAWLKDGIERYGFHGINHRYCAERAARLLRREPASLRLISCHLGNGCSLAAISGGRSVDTTMGFTPLDGLVMGSRSGSVDPGILIHLVRTRGLGADDLDRVLNRESGLLGLSGVSSDMRQVLAAKEAGNPRAGLAFDVFVHRLRGLLGAMLASLGGLDVVVFTAGIGENVPEIRAAACAPFGFLGLQLDSGKNDANLVETDLAAQDSTVRVLVIPAQEDWAIACECWRLLGK